jgi:hypothetical protein
MAGHPQCLEFKLRFGDALYGANRHALGTTIDINAFIAFGSVDDVDITFGDRRIGAFRQTEPASSTVITDFHCH